MRSSVGKADLSIEVIGEKPIIENGDPIRRAPWPQVAGGVLLGYFLPPVMSAIALRRWKDVSPVLLKWSLVISSVCFASFLLFFAMLAVLPAGSPTLHLFMALLLEPVSQPNLS
jgi:hypothetical protein